MIFRHVPANIAVQLEFIVAECLSGSIEPGSIVLGETQLEGLGGQYTVFVPVEGEPEIIEIPNDWEGCRTCLEEVRPGHGHRGRVSLIVEQHEFHLNWFRIRIGDRRVWGRIEGPFEFKFCNIDLVTDTSTLTDPLLYNQSASLSSEDDCI